MARYQTDAPYQQSRAALRKLYGSRSIDASAPQSAQDETPSGRLARQQQAGMSPQKIMEANQQQWNTQFAPVAAFQGEGSRNAPIYSRRAIQAPALAKGYGGLASPEDVRGMVQQGAEGTLMTPYGTVTLPKPLGLIPPANLSSTDLISVPAGPLSSFALPKPSLLNQGSKWSTFG